MKLIALGIFPAFLWVGCAPGNFSLPTTGPLPAQWKHAGNFPTAQPSRDLSHWWKSFNDPTLTRLISEGLSNSPDIDSAVARVREARANRKATASSLFPTLSGSGSAGASFTEPRGSATTTSQSYSAGLSASWEADIYGKNRNNLIAAGANLGAADENLHSVQASLAAQIASAYVQLRSAEAGLDVLQRNIATQEETFQFVSWQTQAGETDAYEENQAKTSLEQAKASIPSVLQSIEQSRNALARLCGHAPGGIDGILGSSTRGVPVPAEKLAVGIPADTIRQRPDVRIAGYQLLASVAQTEATKADRFPSLGLSGSLGVNSLKASKIFDPNAVAGSIAAGLAGPIFDAGRIQANIEASTAATDQAIASYRSTVITGLSEVEDALIACKRSAERLSAIEKATVLARESDRLARISYQAGEIDFLSVLDSQRTLLGLEDSLLSTQSDRTNAYISLYQALGGGW
ncbi:NodT family efflux transporter outer membrane factor (OMF) lipoprotein [Haloferula luteola]|uniref:NodT family efflux transporter outer membrane factor (OMF) lipoprotein n=1 Tax=Haloferula luteola TaxID=595692 RepID=A0A840V0B3_9BACT|nr:efflux transporter outer membrane subunit [Haloferula luteola]MBB5350733.1 NodT family efflux transporter outer membrane factor (OMF) lipoprotein [Haloferula luteola]